MAIEATDTEMAFSGSVVVDHDDTSGLGDGDAPPLVAQALAARAHEICPYSNATRGNLDVKLSAAERSALRVRGQVSPPTRVE